MASGAKTKRIFLSYSHHDRAMVEELAKTLHSIGEEVWYADWEIAPGDSIVDKIFEEGLTDASAFVVVLSNSSANSKWVRNELDVATVRRIEGLTRVIPALADDVEIPQSLRALRWVDLRRGVSEAATEIRNAVHGISKKPPMPTSESLSSSVAISVAGLTPAASEVARQLVTDSDDSGRVPSFEAKHLAELTGLDPVALNDAVEELEERGAARVLRVLGTGKFTFWQVEPTHITYWDLASALDYDPVEDLRVVAAAIVGAGGYVRGSQLAELTGLMPGRLNRAVAHLDDEGLADVSKLIGTFPFSFGSVAANRRTRQFVEEHS